MRNVRVVLPCDFPGTFMIFSCLFAWTFCRNVYAENPKWRTELCRFLNFCIFVVWFSWAKCHKNATVFMTLVWDRKWLRLIDPTVWRFDTTISVCLIDFHNLYVCACFVSHFCVSGSPFCWLYVYSDKLMKCLGSGNKQNYLISLEVENWAISSGFQLVPFVIFFAKKC